MNPFEITDSLVLFLRELFSKKENLQIPSIQDNLWNAVPKQSKIKIEPATKLSEDQVETTPGIIVGRGDTTPTVIGFTGGLDKNSFGRDPLEGIGELRSAEIKTGITVSCVGRSGAEADLLGHEVFFALLDYSYFLVKQFEIGTFNVMSLSAPDKVKGSDDLWACQISISIEYTHKWQITQAQPVWKTSNFDLFKGAD